MSRRTRVRPAAVAGRFYPRDAETLAAWVDDALAAAPVPTGPHPKALVVPHAGYSYSGPVAATGYRTLATARDTVHRVVLLGPAHFVAVRGIAVSGADAFATPLGTVPVDTAARDVVLGRPGVVVDDRAHAPEHSIEVHLPFLQRTLDRFAVLPLVVGTADARTVSDVIDAVWGGSETLIVVSSDLSHYLGHDAALDRDRITAAAIVAGDGDGDALSATDACGAASVRGLLRVARRHDLRGALLDLRSSGDTGGDRDRVVGYGAFAFSSATTP